MEYQISLTDRFRKNYKFLSTNEKKQTNKKLALLAKNPLHSSLRSKRIQGTTDLFECSVNMDIRIIWCYQEQRIIILLDIGHHDILKKL